MQTETQNHMIQPIRSKNKLVSRVLRPNFDNLGDIGIKMIEAAEKLEQNWTNSSLEELQRQNIVA